MSKEEKNLELENEKRLSALTKRQREAYLLRMNNMSYAKIGKVLGISTSAAGQLIHCAERRFREYDRFMDARQRNTVPVEFPVTRGELLLILSGLDLLEADMSKESFKRTSYDWTGRLSYKYELIKALNKRIQMAVYGEIIHEYAED